MMLKRKELDNEKQKATSEILKGVKTAEQELIELRMKKFRGTVTNTNQVRQLRKKIAQFKTLANMKDKS